ncbi:hypothetical protein FR483_N447L [Paramecium bursaria Chlorella virus FR483]|uniref:Uncharacterized protein N447L n=1 Tax=Paramecium bursaria Chlorella virus FR483 TaxID=399781 RepID=A7J7F1_PBCVF|nr:hypothetical protein FR483_N447L [Paramecium bursaria Chlorella virus FR483]ABT15732.1 hypothetical protein FR483_N447L [Paramecium bursaria Chlorella virus FR483]
MTCFVDITVDTDRGYLRKISWYLSLPLNITCIPSSSSLFSPLVLEHMDPFWAPTLWLQPIGTSRQCTTRAFTKTHLFNFVDIK